MARNKETTNNITIVALVIIGILVVFAQLQISAVKSTLGGSMSGGHSSGKDSGGVDLAAVDVTTIQSSAQGIQALFPVDQIQTSDDAIAVMIPTGTPEYGEAMGVSFDDPVNSMEALAAAYNALNAQAKNDPEVWQRYIDLASEPRGVSCEFCCGVGPVGVTKEGRSRCGCKHHPALLSTTLWLMMNTDYTDAEVLQEVYKWKTMFFPKDMVGLASQIAGGDTSVLEELPGMVGGC